MSHSDAAIAILKDLHPESSIVNSLTQQDLVSRLDAIRTEPQTDQDPILNSASFVYSLLIVTDGDEAASKQIASTKGIDSMRDLALNVNNMQLPDVPSRFHEQLFSATPTASIQRVLQSSTVLPSTTNSIQRAAANILDANPDLDVSNSVIHDGYQVSQDEDQTSAIELLRTLQRLGNVVAKAEEIEPLLEAGFTSAAQIASFTSEDFISAVPKLEQDTSKTIHARAVGIKARNELALVALNQTSSNHSIPSTHSTVQSRHVALTATANSKANGINLDSLFGDSVTTACDSCRSVLSPSAYLVELLSGSVLPQSVIAELLRRRPDIANLELSCANTNTALPYIDLVNEILESVLATNSNNWQPDIKAFNVYDTDSSADLIAEPRNINLSAYDHTRVNFAPIGLLPFQRELEEMRLLLRHLGTDRLDFLDLFGPKETSNFERSMTVEFLGIPENEFEALTGESLIEGHEANIFINDWKIWNYPSLDAMMDHETGLQNLKNGFVPRSGYTYDEILVLLDTKFVNPKIPTSLKKAHSRYSELWAMVDWSKDDNDSLKWQGIFAALGIVDPSSKQAKDVANILPTLGKDYIVLGQYDGPEKYSVVGEMFVGPGQENFVGHLQKDAIVRDDEDHMVAYLRPTDGRWYFYDRSQTPDQDVYYKTGQDPSQVALIEIRFPGQVSPVVARIPCIGPGKSGALERIGWSSDFPQGIGDKGDWYMDLTTGSGEPNPDTLSLRTLSGFALSVEKWTDINRFIRLQRRAKWSIVETDQALATFDARKITPKILHQLACVRRLQDRTGLPQNTLLSLWGDIPRSLYDSLFLRHSITRSDPAFLATSDDEILADGSQKFSSHIPALCSALGVTAGDISVITQTVGSSTDWLPLNITSVSMLCRYVTLCRMFGISISLLPCLVSLYPAPLVDAKTTLEAYENWQLLNTRGATMDQLQYIASGTDLDGTRRISSSVILQQAYLVRNTFLDIDKREIQIAKEDPTDQDVKDAASYLPNLTFWLDVLNGKSESILDIPSDVELVASPVLPTGFTAIVDQNSSTHTISGLKYSGILSAPEIHHLESLATVPTLPQWIKVIHTFTSGIVSKVKAALSPLLSVDPAMSLAANIVCAGDRTTTPQTKRRAFLDIIAREKLESDQLQQILSSIFNTAPKETIKLFATWLPQNLIIPGPSSKIDGYFFAPDTDQYIFGEDSSVSQVVTVPHSGDKHETPLQFDTVISLVGGQCYRIIASNPTWRTRNSEKSDGVAIPPQYLLPESFVDSIAALLDKMNRLLAAASLFGLMYDEITYGITRLGLVSKDTYSVNEISQLAKYANLRDKLHADTKYQLIDFLALPAFASVDAASNSLASFTHWPLDVIKSLLSTFAVTSPSLAETSGPVVLDLNMLERVQKAYSFCAKTGISDISMLSNAGVGLTYYVDLVAKLRQFARGRVDEETWNTIATSLYNPLRQQSRDALVATCLNQFKGDDIEDTDALFEYFLIDVSMGSCLQTSRIKQAISSVQVFVQRCLLGLESSHQLFPQTFGPNFPKHWEWMQSYGLWEANRRVFLYPENWLQPSLRPTKTSVFTDIESSLLQDATLTIDQIVTKYISGLADIADLEPVTIFQGPSCDHCFARTSQAPHKFFHRMFDRSTNCWTPWVAINVDIPTVKFTRTYALDTLSWSSAFDLATQLQQFEIHHPSRDLGSGSYIVPYSLGTDDHLVIFLPILQEKCIYWPEDKSTKYAWEVGMAISELRDGKWMPKITATETLLPFFSDVDLVTFPYNTWTDQLEHQRRRSTFRFWPYTDGAGRINVNVYLVVQLLPYISSQQEYPYRECYLGKYTYDVGQLHITERRIAGADVTQLKEAWTLGKYTSSTTGWHSVLPCVTFTTAIGLKRDVYPQGIEVDFDPLGTNQPKRYTLWWPQTAVSPLPVALSHTFTRELLSIAVSGSSQDIYDFFSEDKDRGKSYKGDKPSANLTSMTDQSLGIWDITLSNVVFHELHTPNSIYNWEILVHLPMTLINYFMSSQQLDRALDAVKLVFNPLTTDPNAVWRFLPFKHAKTRNALDLALANSDDIAEWELNPFSPFTIARRRPSAYMKWFAYKYIEIMIAKGDFYFRQYTLESLPLAIQCYVQAAHVYGPIPATLPSVGKAPVQTFNSVKASTGWQAFGNSLVAMEVNFPFRNESNVSSRNLVNLFGSAAGSYFCIPPNPARAALRTNIDDRLYKIRHCQDINGKVRKLALWDPPLDPAALVRAVAGGASLSSVLEDVDSPMPNYRFIFLVQKALEICAEVRNIGSTVLSMRERKDGEALAVLRTQQENVIYSLSLDLKSQQLDEARKGLDALIANRIGVASRMRTYLSLLGEEDDVVPTEDDEFKPLPMNITKPTLDGNSLRLSNYEKLEVDLSIAGLAFHTASSIVAMQSIAASLVPDFKITGEPLGVGTGLTFGGSQLGPAVQRAASFLQLIGDGLNWGSSNASRNAQFQRQLHERLLQANSAGYEIKAIDQQIAAQKIRIAMAQKEIDIQNKTMEHNVQMMDYLRSKYTNAELYTWMLDSLQRLYQEAYSLAYDVARRAERTYRFERGLQDSSFIKDGYWEANHDGLLAGEGLHFGLRRLEDAYTLQRGWDFELNKSFSLRSLNPAALMRLRTTSSTGDFSIPEVLFDADFPGHYQRRIKSISVSIPCIVGPYTPVNATLTLLEHRYRVDPTSAGTYDEATTGSDPRFRTDLIPITSVGICNGQADAGVFDLNFRDERYMPFEGAGAISKWRLELPEEVQQFDYSTISDVVLHIRYTSLDGGGGLKTAATSALTTYLKDAQSISWDKGLCLYMDIRAEFATSWASFKSGRPLEIKGLRDRLPFFARSRKQSATVRKVKLVVQGTSAGLEDVVDLAVGNGQVNHFDLTAGNKLSETATEVSLDLTLPINSEDVWKFSFQKAAASEVIRFDVLILYTF